MNFRILFPEDPKSFQDWKNLFQNSAAVHFASSQTFNVANIGKVTITITITITQYCCTGTPLLSNILLLRYQLLSQQQPSLKQFICGKDIK